MKDNDKAQNTDVMELKINLELVVELKMKQVFVRVDHKTFV